MAIQEAADSSLERVDFQVLLNENSAIFIAQVQRTVERAADRNFRQILAHSRFYLSARFLRPRTPTELSHTLSDREFQGLSNVPKFV